MLNLKKYGFSFEQFEHDCNPGLVYYFDNCEHIIGGKCDESPCTNEDQYIAEKGTWLPNASHLMLWLQWKQNCDVSIQYTAENRYFYGKFGFEVTPFHMGFHTKEKRNKKCGEDFFHRKKNTIFE